jgi:hydrogenase/urease accessory protein HupE
MTPDLLRGLAALLAWLTLASVPLPAQAHKPSDAYLTLAVAADGRISQRLDIALRDLDRDLDLDADADGQLRWGAVRSRWGRLEQLADTAVVVQADGQPCRRIDTGMPQLDTHVDGTYAVLRRTLQCTGSSVPAALTIDYRLFAASDPTHRGITRIDLPGAAAPLTRVLVPGAAPVTLATGTPGAAAPATPWARTASFFADGLHHIAIGADHLLFLVTLLMVAVWRRQGDGWAPRAAAGSAWRETLRLVSAFTVAHSLTLGLAASGVLAPPTRWVESLIAASVCVAALDNLRPFLPGPRWMTVAVFGLVHGFGFAGPLQDLGLRGSDLALPLLGFNLGVEAGQLLVVAVLLPLALRLRASDVYRRWIVRPGSALAALLALGWTLERALALPLLPAIGR